MLAVAAAVTAAVAAVASATEGAEGEATVAVTARWVTIGLKMMNFSPTAAKQRRCAPLPSPLASTCRRPA